MRFAAFSIAALFVLGMSPTGRADDEVTEAKQRIEHLTAQVEALLQRLDASNETQEGKQAESEQTWTTKVYRVADLVERQNTRPENGKHSDAVHSNEELIPLMRFIETKIAPATWGTTLVGTGTIAPYAQNHSLVIFQSAEVHDQIRLELKKLRDAYRVLDEFDQIRTYESFPAP